MQEKIGKPAQGVRFKDRDFSGELVSAEGMITLSKPSKGKLVFNKWYLLYL